MKNLTHRFAFIFVVAIFLTSCSSGLNAQDQTVCNLTKVNDQIPPDLTRWWSPINDYYFNKSTKNLTGEALDQFIIDDALFGLTKKMVERDIIEILDEVGVKSSVINNPDLKQIALTVNNYDKSSKNESDVADFYSKQFDSMIRFCYKSNE
jgi:hypothetical protein